MRLDKYLKVSRIIKRRTLAKELLDLGRVEINGRSSKPSTEVKPNDILKIRLKDRYLTIKVLKVLETVKADDASDTYLILNEEYIR